jgi:hypothetical protein
MNGSDEASPRRRQPGRDFPILARDLIFAYFPQGGTEGSNPAPSSGESVSRPKPLSYVENPGFPRGCARLPPIEDGLCDIRREIAEADQPREIGPADTFPLGECGKRNAFAVGECRVELARPEEQLDQSRVGFRRGKPIGAVDHHSDFPPGAAQPYWHRHGLDSSSVMLCKDVAVTSSSTPSRGGRRRMSIW